MLSLEIILIRDLVYDFFFKWIIFAQNSLFLVLYIYSTSQVSAISTTPPSLYATFFFFFFLKFISPRTWSWTQGCKSRWYWNFLIVVFLILSFTNNKIMKMNLTYGQHLEGGWIGAFAIIGYCVLQMFIVPLCLSYELIFFANTMNKQANYK